MLYTEILKQQIANGERTHINAVAWLIVHGSITSASAALLLK